MHVSYQRHGGKADHR